mmetsp:Transcript_64435/g.106672  ORF Transcript_64435/g.106672 Transcript_64435/m.106672 type:complete len:235 (+) Transcript_64435:366-1070(+)
MVILHGGRPLVGLKRWELLDLVEQAHPLLQLETGQNVDRLLLQGKLHEDFLLVTLQSTVKRFCIEIVKRLTDLCCTQLTFHSQHCGCLEPRQLVRERCGLHIFVLVFDKLLLVLHPALEPAAGHRALKSRVDVREQVLALVVREDAKVCDTGLERRMKGQGQRKKLLAGADHAADGAAGLHRRYRVRRTGRNGAGGVLLKFHIPRVVHVPRHHREEVPQAAVADHLTDIKCHDV